MTDRRTVTIGTGLIALLALPGITPAQERLAPVEVTATRLQRDWLGFPAAVSVVERQAVQQGRRQRQLDQALARVPGVFARNGSNFAQDLRVSIRGFGARSPWGIRGIRVRVDGIPATLVDGQSQVDAIDPGIVQRIEVLRGPFSALYGSATGGVIDITTEQPDPAGNHAIETAASANGDSRLSVTAGRQYRSWGYIATATDLQQQGHRQHSRVHKRLLTAKANRRIGDTGKLRVVTRLLHAPDTQDPGGVTLQRARTRPHSARPANRLYDSRQSARQQTLGLAYTDQLDRHRQYRAQLFYSHRDFIQYLPYRNGGVVGFQRQYYGGGLQLTGRTHLAGRQTRWTAGIDLRQQDDDRQRHDNLHGRRGPRVFDETQRARNAGIYLQSMWAATPRLSVSAGLRHDWLKFAIDDHAITASDPDDSGDRRHAEFSGNLGISYQWRPGQRIYANVSTAFESPTFAEFANPSGHGGFNPRLDPQTALHREIGAKGVLGQRLRYQVALFQSDVKDELVARQSASGRDYYENAGESRHRGIEISITGYPADTLTLTGSYSLTQHRFLRFVDSSGNHLAGKRIPGLPRHTLFAELAWQRDDLGFASLDVLWVGERYADNANRVRVTGYTVVNAHLGRHLRLGRHTLTLYLGADNLLDEDYFDNLRLNAFGGRYYETAAGRTVYGGVRLAL